MPVERDMNTADHEGEPFWKIPPLSGLFAGICLLLAGVCFGYLCVFTQLPLWACGLIALPSGILTLIVILRLQFSSDAPSR